MSTQEIDDTADADNRGVLRRALGSASFVEKAGLLLLTALLSGVLIPLCFMYLEARSATRERIQAQQASERARQLEADRERDKAILEAQSEMLMQFSDVLMTYETLALDVSWYGTPNIDNEQMLNLAYQRYSEQTPELLTRWRLQASRASILVDPEIAQKMSLFLLDVMAEQDLNLNRLYSQGAAPPDWQQQHEISNAMLHRANDLFKELAKDIGITRESLLQ
ncbi:hypothetical protein ACUNV4_12290 [Granulosicoccus sp. 3-233]|uniref:hypothetical protein n=1 Tax=Granulosicoccus sp. 3-233 TaxID=3417969 RepID=UPI003D32ADFD